MWIWMEAGGKGARSEKIQRVIKKIQELAKLQLEHFVFAFSLEQAIYIGSDMVLMLRSYNTFRLLQCNTLPNHVSSFLSPLTKHVVLWAFIFLYQMDMSG